MSDFSEKRKQALKACDKVINGIEDGTISVSSSLLLCKQIARLVNDIEGQQWLEYEYSGYPRGKDGRILHDAWNIGAVHGRSFPFTNKDSSQVTCIFTELCSELEAAIESSKKAINNFSTQGYSVSGDYALAATSQLTSSVSRGTKDLIQSIQVSERRLSILKAQYYDYAIKWQIELQFGNTAKLIFEEYQEKVDNYFSLLPTTAIRKLNAIEELLDDGNSERYAQVLTSCRRLWSEIAENLFNEILPNYTEQFYKTKSGKAIDVSGDHNNNKLSAIIETLQSKATKNTLVGSQMLYLVDWIEQISDSQNAGVHSEVTREQAMQCIIHTYIVLGDILSLKAEAEK